MKLFPTLFFTAILSVGCNSVPTSTALPTATLRVVTPTFVQNTATPFALPTPTDWLPYNPSPSAEGCSEFTATLPIKGTENLSHREISRRLFEIYLGHYKSPEFGGLCRLEDFKMEDVREDKRLDFLAQEQKVDFVNTVEYSVQVKETPTGWVAGNGVLGPNGWVNHKFLIIGLTKVNDQYVLKLIGTGP
jgi:hypothetical protein